MPTYGGGMEIFMEKIRVVLPEKYNLVVGDMFQLFFRGVVEAPNPFVYDIVAVCEKGRNFPRYYEFLPEEEGNFELVISVYDADKNLLGMGKTMLCVKKAVNPKRKVNIMCVGDSLTGGGQWVAECSRRLKSSGGEPEGLAFENFNFVGTCNKDGAGYEAYGGWKWNSFTSTSFDGVWVINMGHIRTDNDQHSVWKAEDGSLWQLETILPDMIKFMRYGQHEGMLEKGTSLKHINGAQNTDDLEIEDMMNESVSPFLDKETKKIDIKKYCEKHNYDDIDVFYILLGYNGLHTAKVPLREYCNNIVDEAKVLVDIIHKQFPKAKVKISGVIVPSVTGGMSQYGAKLPYCDDYGMTRFCMDLNIAYEKWTKEEGYNEFMEFINLSGQFDTDYSLPMAAKPVNVRSTITEMIGTNGLHPSLEGYMQVADAMFRSMVHLADEIE